MIATSYVYSGKGNTTQTNSVHFGHHFGRLGCSRLSDIFRYSMWKEGHVIFNYVDDLIGIGPESSVHVAF